METTHETHPFLSDMQTLRARAREAMDQGAVVGDSVDSDSLLALLDALLATESSEGLAVTTVVVDPGARANTVLDSGTVAQVVLDDAVNAFRPTPSVGS